jgi:hypothetical protein
VTLLAPLILSALEKAFGHLLREKTQALRRKLLEFEENNQRRLKEFTQMRVLLRNKSA